MNSQEATLQAGARLTLNRLSDDQLAVLHLVASADWDPRETICWPDAEPLFTGRSPSGVPVAHSETKRVIRLVVAERLPAEPNPEP